MCLCPVPSVPLPCAQAEELWAEQLALTLRCHRAQLQGMLSIWCRGGRQQRVKELATGRGAGAQAAPAGAELALDADAARLDEAGAASEQAGAADASELQAVLRQEVESEVSQGCCGAGGVAWC